MELDEDGTSSYILVNSFGRGKLHFVDNQDAISVDIIGHACTCYVISAAIMHPGR